MLLVQFRDANGAAVCGLLDGDIVRAHAASRSTYDHVRDCLAAGQGLIDSADAFGGAAMGFADLAAGERLLPPLTHPDPRRCLVSGTGLTHRGSADTRALMHMPDDAAASDTMRLFTAGVKGGRPAGDAPGVLPEWFYKGDGDSIVAPGAAMPSPGFALADGEEPELAMLYVIDNNGIPRRIGSAIGNEFSDHETERLNYLYLAHSKLRDCSFGPALRVGAPPADIHGETRILRAGREVWRKRFATGEANMTHNLANLEHHHFRYARHCRPGDVHVHFLGTAVLSFADGFMVDDGDVIEIGADSYGPPLRNVVRRAPDGTVMTKVQPA
ncbi:FAH family protein [Sandaracinobacteroides saxicola]|uniref:FAH family protein n=2 Tax=Sandaracinobacteroides saxicola TaxID=2759707 RepID=A0A7G5IMI7_9SPHN|nr:FAH family protein [Sandaracinobacteroides saxicola]